MFNLTFKMIHNKYKLIIKISIVFLLAGMIVFNSSWGKERRYYSIRNEFREAEFFGIVRRIEREKNNHNELFIYYGDQQGKFPLTFVRNKLKLLKDIHVGDRISKTKGTMHIDCYQALTNFQVKKVEVLFN